MTESDNMIIPEIELTQWREGRVLSAEDIALITEHLRQLDDERDKEINDYQAGREAALREIGGQELVEFMHKQDVSRTEVTTQNALQRYYQRVREVEAAQKKVAN